MADVEVNGGSGTAEGLPVGDDAGEDIADLAAGKVGDGVGRINDDGHGIGTDDGVIQLDVAGFGLGLFVGEQAAGGGGDIASAGEEGIKSGAGAARFEVDGDFGVIFP